MTEDKIKFTTDALEALRARVQDYRQKSNDSWNTVAGKMGVATSTLQAFCSNKYSGDNQKVADEIAKWFRTEETQELFADQVWTPGFQPTATAKLITDHMIYAKLGNMIIVMGDPGVGKTFALKRFAKESSNVWIVTASPSRSNYNAFMYAILDAMNVSATGRSGFHLSQRIRGVLGSRQAPLLIVDEAQHLGERVLEEIRSIHDETGCGVAFVGNRETTRTIDGTRTATFAQRSSRISKRETLSGPMGWDVKIMLEAWGVTDGREATFLERIATRPGGGALRQMSKVLELASLMASSEKRRRNLEDLKEAADQLNAGIAA